MKKLPETSFRRQIIPLSRKLNTLHERVVFNFHRKLKNSSFLRMRSITRQITLEMVQNQPTINTIIVNRNR